MGKIYRERENLLPHLNQAAFAIFQPMLSGRCMIVARVLSFVYFLFFIGYMFAFIRVFNLVKE